MNSIFVLTDHPIAFDSLDHTHPLGTKQDNYKNPSFNGLLIQLLGEVRCLDLGCAGGGFCASLLEAGQVAVGLEGSDYSLREGRAEWSHLANKNLFTCDITYDFVVKESGEPASFNVVTCWEVMEHLPEDRLDTVIENVHRHLSPKGLWIMSVSSDHKDFHHVTVQNKEWWYNKLSKGFVRRDDLVSYFGDHWIRGPRQDAPDSFHIILEKQ